MKKAIAIIFATALSLVFLNSFATTPDATCDKVNSNSCKIIGKEDSTGALIVTGSTQYL